MRFPQKRKQIFGACILFTMFALALATAVLAASGQWASSGSYSLVIQKQFATKVEQLNKAGEKVMVEVPQAVLDAAKKQTYRFHIEGYREVRNNAGELIQIPIDDIVEIGPNSKDWEAAEGAEDGVLRWKLSEELKSDGPIHVSVTEITNDITLEVEDENGVKKEYNMGDSRAEMSTLFDESPQVRELNNNGKIVLSRPETKLVPAGGNSFIEKEVTTTSNFRITSKWTADPSVKPPDWEQKALNTTVTLKPGDKHEFTGLPAGEYTIEDLSVSGYRVKLDGREETVEKPQASGGGPSVAAYGAWDGEADKHTHGSFYINSAPGTLTITAGGTEGDGDKHYYTIKRVGAPDGALPFTDRTTDAVLSGEKYVLEDLPRGQYEVTEYTFTDAPTKFTVKVPYTKDEEKSLKFRNYTASGETISRYYVTMGGDYVDGFRYGPIYDKNGKMLAETDLYNIRYIANWLQEDGTTVRSGYKADNRKGSYYYTLKDTIVPGTGNQRLAFGVGETTANKGGYCLLKWIEHTRVENDYTAPEANINYSITIDDRGWMEVTAPAADPTKPGSNSVTYTYTLRKEAGGEAVKTPLTLHPGETGKFEGLDKGSYLLTETMSFAEPVGFKMDIEGGPVKAEEAGKPSEITVMQPRLLTIEKSASPNGDDRDYTFLIEKVENSARAARSARAADEGTQIGAATGADDKFTGDLKFPIKVVLKAGEHSLKINLPAGTYKVTPVDDMTEVFELSCTDSSQVHAKVPSNQSSTVTFTNVFTEGSYGYRYVHEYYIRHGEEGHYTYDYEGNSPITTVGGRSNPDEFYNSVDITKEKVFTYKLDGIEQTFHYDYMPENNGYGKVITDATDAPTDANGLRLRNRATEKGGTAEIRYGVNAGMTQTKKIGVDTEKSQVIILRYFRVIPEEQKGSYKYVHIYYRRDANGDTWEGTSEITNVTGQRNVAYDAKTVPQMPYYQPKNDVRHYYVHDQRPDYGTLVNDHTYPHIEHYPVSNDSSDNSHFHYDRNSSANHVLATEDGQNIIILRYYREVKPEDLIGSYKVVHEYYYREKLEDSGGEEDSGSEGGELTDPESETPPVDPTIPTDPDPGSGGTPPAGETSGDQPQGGGSSQDDGQTGGDAQDSKQPQEPEKNGPEGGSDQGTDAPKNDEPKAPEDGTSAPDASTEPTDTGDKSEAGTGGDSSESGDPPQGLDASDSQGSDPPQDSGAAPVTLSNDDAPSDTAAAPEDKDSEPPKEPENTDPKDDSQPQGTENSSEDGNKSGGTENNDTQSGDKSEGDPNGDPQDGEQPKEPESDTPEGDDQPQAPGNDVSGDSSQPQAPSGNDDPQDNEQPKEPESDTPEGNDQTQAPGNGDPGNSDQLEGNGEPTLQAEGDSTFSGTLSSDGTYAYIFKGNREVETIQAPLGSQHWGSEVGQKPSWKNDQYTYKDVVYGIADGNGGYRYVTNMEWASSTKEENQIIILRYIRGDDVQPDDPTPPPTPPSSSKDDPTYAYRVVHEYYLEDADGNRTLEGKTSVSKVDSSSAGRYDQSDVERLTSFDGREYVYAEDAYGTWSRGQDYTAKPGKTYINANTSGDQIIILRYVRKEPPKTEVSYKVIHEYYFRDPEGKEILVGTSEIRAVLEASPDVQYTQADVGREPDFQGETYTYFGDGYGTVSGQDYSAISGQQYVLATGSGEQIIILRYVREEKPEDPSQTPEDPPKDPEHPTEPPDPNDPDSPDEVTIWENEVPKTYIKVWDPEKEEWVYLPEVDVPLWNRIPHVSIGNNIPGKDLLVTIPQPDAGSYVPVPDAPPENRVPPTGDEDRSGLWAALAAAALCGCAALTIVPGKRKTK